MDGDSQVEALAGAFEEAGGGLLLAVTGAGISLASGIPTFRGSDPGAVWKRDLTELATLRYFLEDPVGSWEWYLSRFEKLGAARPNPAHLALAELERWQVARGGEFLLITQNIDTLHEQSGSTRMIKVHGSSDKVRCSRDGCTLGSPTGALPRPDEALAAFAAAPGEATLPRCADCGSPLRPHVLWFDELYASHADYRWSEVQRSLHRMRAALCIGTSFAVGFTEALLQAAAWSRVPVFAIDPTPTLPVVSRSLRHLVAPAEELLPRVVTRLTSP